MQAGTLLRTHREAAGMTQAALAARLGTSQPAIARLERPGSNPRLTTIADALRATGHRLELSTSPAGPAVDESLIVRNLRLTPAERLAAFTAAYRNVRDLANRARRL